jgi:opacity protein-like surface antigen
MTKRIWTVAAVLAAFCSTFAQGFDDYNYSSTTNSSSSGDRFGLYFSAGAGFSIGGDFRGSSLVSEDAIIAEVDDEFLNVGRGLKLDLGAMYRFLPSVDVMAGVVTSFTIPRTEVVTDVTINAFGTRTITTYTYHAAQIGPKVMVAPRFQIFDLLDVYVGAGLGLYFTPLSLNIERQVVGGITHVQEVEYDTKPTVPFIGMAGVEYPLARRVILGLDMSFEAINVTVKGQKVLTSSFPQGDWPEQTERYEDDVGDREPQKRIPASNWGIRLGARFPLF